MNSRKVKELRRCLADYYEKFPKAVPVGHRRVAGEGSQVIAPRRIFYRRMKRIIKHYGLRARFIKREIFGPVYEEERSGRGETGTVVSGAATS